MRKRSDLMFTFFHILPLSESQRWGGVPWLSSMAIFAASWPAKLHQRKKRTPKKNSAKKVSFCHKRNINVIEIIYVFLVTIFGCWVLDTEKKSTLKNRMNLPKCWHVFVQVLVASHVGRLASTPCVTWEHLRLGSSEDSSNDRLA